MVFRMTDKTRVAYLVTHPIQYQAPLLKEIAQEPTIELTVFFCSDTSSQPYVDKGFNIAIEWDTPLLEGYNYDFLPAIGKSNVLSFWRPFNYGMARRLKAGNFDVLWIHGYARFFHWTTMLTAKFLGIKVLIRDEATHISTQRNILKRGIKHVFMKLLSCLSDGFLAIGTLNRKYYCHYGIDKQRIFSMPYTVDNHYFQQKANFAQPNRKLLREKLDLEPSRPIILYASKMIARKRAGDLLDAYIKLSEDGFSEPHPYLLFIGDGKMRESLESRSSELGWKSIKFLGFVNQSHLPQYYDLCDVFVLPSTYEPWGLVVNEVMNAAKAVIVSDQVGSGKDLIKNNTNGYVFNARNIDELHQALHKIVSNLVHCKAMGQKSLEIINSWSYAEDINGLKKALCYVLNSA